MNKNGKFIITQSEADYELLKTAGFTFVTKQDGKFFFINEPNKIVFSKLDNATTTNILSI